MKLRENIVVSDIQCNCGCGFSKMSSALLDILQYTRTYYGRPIHINSGNHSGCRCDIHNASVGGLPNSKHLPDGINETARACDFHVEGVPNKEVYELLSKRFANCLGLGLYSWGIHIDDRMSGSFRWDKTI